MLRHGSQEQNDPQGPANSHVGYSIDGVDERLPSNPSYSPITEAEPPEDVEPGRESNEDEDTFVYENYNLKDLPLELTESISSRMHLRKLSLKGNSLTNIPPSLGKLPRLYYLNLSHNNFAELPECIIELQNLEILDMSHNSLKTLPTSLARLPQLVGLSVVANNLEVLPPVIADLPRLVILEIEDNPIRMPSQLPALGEDDDEESWLISVREYITAHRIELENALRPRISSSKQLDIVGDGIPRVVSERMRSASESGTGSSLRAAKRMGFVMSRNATDQSYVANLHARGLSHDSHMLEAISQPTHSVQQKQQSALGASGSASIQIDLGKAGSAPNEGYTHARSISSLATTAEHSDLQPPPRSPIARSPFASPWSSPRPSITESEPQSAASGRLSTLAEEHDAASDGEEEEVGPKSNAVREASTSSTDAPSIASGFRRASTAMPVAQETMPKSPYELEEAASSLPLFKDSYQDHGNSSRPAAPGGISRSTSVSSSTGGTHRLSSTPSLPTPTSANSNALDNIAFALEEFGKMLVSIWQSLPSAIAGSVKEAQDAVGNRKYPKALLLYSVVLERLTVPLTFHQVASKLTRRQQRQFATTIMLAFPELEAAWRQLQQAQLFPFMMESTSQERSWAQDEQLHTQLDHATKGAQTVLVLLNDVVAKSAVAAVDGPEPPVTMASRVRDLSSVCIKCSSATKSVRKLLDHQVAPHARTLQLSERRRFWDEVNSFLKAVISTLAAVKAALPDIPLLADGHVGAEVANLTKVAKEIPPLLEQSSYRLLLDSNAPPIPDPSDLSTPVQVSAGAPDLMTMSSPSVVPSNLQYNSQYTNSVTSPFSPHMVAASQQPMSSQASLPPPTPLTASLGAAAQALISPSDRMERQGDGYIQFGLQAYMDKQS